MIGWDLGSGFSSRRAKIRWDLGGMVFCRCLSATPLGLAQPPGEDTLFCSSNVSSKCHCQKVNVCHPEDTSRVEAKEMPETCIKLDLRWNLTRREIELVRNSQLLCQGARWKSGKKGCRGKGLLGVNRTLSAFLLDTSSTMKGDEEEVVSRRREEEVCKISVDDTYEGVSTNSPLDGDAQKLHGRGLNSIDIFMIWYYLNI